MASSRFASGFVGFLIGVVTGLGIAALAATFLAMGPSPFMDKVGLVTTNVDPARELNGDVNPNDALNKTEEHNPANTNEATNTPPSIKTIKVGDSTSAQEGTTKPSRVYFLQAGAFKNQDAAVNRCASLALEAFACEAKQSNGLWRVLVGPYDSRVGADEVQRYLKDNKNIDADVFSK